MKDRATDDRAGTGTGRQDRVDGRVAAHDLPDPTAVIPWQTFAGWQQLLIAVWAVSVIGAVVVLLLSIAQLREATGNNPAQGDQAKTRAVRVGSVLMGLVGSGSILTTMFGITG